MAPYSYFHKNVNTCIKKDKVKCSKRISDINAGGRIYQLVLLFCTFLLSPIYFFCDKSIHSCICIQKYFQTVYKNCG